MPASGRPPLSSANGLTRHMLGASGAVEAAVSAGAMIRGILPPAYQQAAFDLALSEPVVQATC